MTKPSVSSKNTWEVLAAFAFGTLFILIIFITSLYFSNPTVFQYEVFRTILALAAAGFGAVLPGFLDVRFKNWLRAGGALALFVVVYFFSPVPLPVTESPLPPSPLGDPQTEVDAWLADIDRGSYAQAYDSMADIFKQKYSVGAFSEFVKRIRDKLGKATSRTLQGSNAYESPPGFPKGHYRELVFNTRSPMIRA